MAVTTIINITDTEKAFPKNAAGVLNPAGSGFDQSAEHPTHCFEDIQYGNSL